MSTGSTPEAALTIEHEGNRFVAIVDGVEAGLDYRQVGELMTITHTSVPETIAGQGVAGELTRAAFEHARAKGWKVEPACAYAAGWVKRHSEYDSLLA